MSYLISKPAFAKELFVIDGGLPDIPTLIEAIGADKWIVVLEPSLGPFTAFYKISHRP